MNKVIKILITLAVSILIGFVLMIGVYSIPTDRLYINAENSVQLFEDGTNRKIANWTGFSGYSKMDNFTDAWMINLSMCREGNGVIDNAMSNYYYEYKDYSMGSDTLVELLNGNENYFISSYSRYWHGYMVYLIPLLSIMDVGQIRTLIMAFEFVLVALVLYKLGKINVVYLIAYSVTLIFINPMSVALNFQYADIYIISLVSMLVILYFGRKIYEKGNIYLLFLVIGVCTSFFDFLTYPLVSWGLALLTLLIVIGDKSIKEKLFIIFECSITWIAGYFGMWAGKWIVSSIFTGENVITNALSAVSLRTGGGGYSFTEALSSVIDAFNTPSYVLILFLGILSVILYVLKNGHISLPRLKSNLPVLLIVLSSFVWFFVLRNHTVVHPHFEYRTLSVSILATMLYIIESFEIKRELD